VGRIGRFVRSITTGLGHLRVRRMLIAFVAVPLFMPAGEAQSLTEGEVKAVGLYNFAKFVEWPPEALPTSDAPIVIGVLGNDPLASDVERIVRGKTANGRSLVVKRFRKASDFQYCHILFVGEQAKSDFPRLLAGLRNTSVLTVSESDRFTRSGGIVNISFRDNRLLLEVNQSAAERAGLKINSKLLKVARVVRD